MSDLYRDKKNIWIAATLVALVTFIVYFPALQNGFVNWDDDILVYENPYIRSIGFQLLGWDVTALTDMWAPLLVLSFALDYAVWGLNPTGYHLTNNIFHTLNTILVFILTTRLLGHAKPGKNNLGKEAIIAGSVTSILFGIHPLRVESVVWVTERKDVLYSFFFLLSILAYIKYISTNLKRMNYYAAALIFFIFALMSKVMAVSLPIVLLILDFYPFRRLKIEDGPRNILRILFEKLPFFLSALLLSILIMLPHPSSDNILIEEMFTERIILATHTYIFYLTKILLPLNLALVYPSITNVNFLDFKYMGALLLFIMITFFSIRSLKKDKGFAVIWFYYITTLMPVIGIDKIAAFAAANRYTYLPSLGPFLLAGLGIAAIFERSLKKRYQALVITVLFLILALLGIKTTTQTVIWKDSITLWSYEIKHFPDIIYIAYNNRGTAYREIGAQQLAIKDFDTAIKLNPKYTEAYYNRGNAHSSLEDYQQAIKDYSKAIELNPEYQEAYNNRGITYMTLSEYQEAIKDLSMVIKLNPGDAKAYNLRGAAYVNASNYRQAIEDLDMAVKLKPGFADAYYNRGTTYRIFGDNRKAVNDFSTAITLKPQYAEAYNNRGNAYRDLGNYQKAIEDYGMAVKLNPQDEIAYRNRGIAYRSLGNNGQALKDFKKAEEIKHR